MSMQITKKDNPAEDGASETKSSAYIKLGLCLGWKGQLICWREGREGGGGEGGGRGRGGRGEGGMTVIHIIIGMFNSNPMIPQYLNNNLT